ncbi:hypothetical protein DFS33DRAFT_946766 [Desarmillaria ectypa]|nr:hypothetical protein DFS33DRAFT_946766 [Desarmillaria ectypa]
MDVHIAMMDPDPSAVMRDLIWSDTLCKLRNVDVPKFLFGIIVASPGPYDMFVIYSVRYFRQITYIAERNLEDYDSRNVNKRLWMASNRRYTLALRFLISFFHRWEYRLRTIWEMLFECLPLPDPRRFSLHFLLQLDEQIFVFGRERERVQVAIALTLERERAAGISSQ